MSASEQQSLVEIEDEVPLAVVDLDEDDQTGTEDGDQTGKVSKKWWSIIPILAAAAGGKYAYDQNKKKKEEAAKSEEDKDKE